MIPEYRIKINGTLVNAVMGDDMVKKIAKESGQEFFRTSLNGKLVLLGSDYDWLSDEDIGDEFVTVLQRRAGAVWSDYASGVFSKTDCKWDADSKRVEISLRPYDRYTELLEGLDKEFDLIKLAPARESVSFYKRPAIQIYVAGESTVGCFIAGAWWEQQCSSETNNSVLVNTYRFYKAKTFHKLNLYGTGAPSAVAGDYVGEDISASLRGRGGEYYASPLAEPDEFGPGQDGYYYAIIRDSDSEILFESEHNEAPPVPGDALTFSAVSPDASGTFSSLLSEINIYARAIHDNQSVGYALPSNDIVSDNRNYSRVVPLSAFTGFAVTADAVSTPTVYGLTEGGEYFTPPALISGVTRWLPVAKSQWALSSVWFGFLGNYSVFDQSLRVRITQSDWFPIWSVIKVLLAQIAPTLSHAGDANHSALFYSSDSPFNYLYNIPLFITPKSNVLAGQYDRPAQKAPVTLRAVLDMLTAYYDCAWFVDSSNRLRIEHISWFKNGGTYSGSPALTANLTALLNPKNGRRWSTGTNRWEFDKGGLPARIRLRFMDPQTEYFDAGYIEISSPYVDKSSAEEVSTPQFSADIDYMLLAPEEISKEGFVAARATLVGGAYEIASFGSLPSGYPSLPQNNLLSWRMMQEEYHRHNLPGWSATMNGAAVTVLGIRRAKKHEVEYPSADDPDPMKLIRTSLGDGSIESIDINISSRMNKVTLHYDTE